MNVTKKTKKTMTKAEVALLIDLIESTPIINSKETNAETNRFKEDAWISLARTFNAKSRSAPKSKIQLKTKWDNLKKAARKRSQEIGTNNLTVGGKPVLIPYEELLETVTRLMESTCTGSDVPSGGDSSGSNAEVSGADSESEVTVDIEAESPCIGLQPKRRKICEWDFSCGSNSKEQSMSSKYFFGKAMSRQLSSKNKGKNKAGSKIEESIIARNLAIAKYYEKKTEKINFEIELLKLAQEEKNGTVNDNVEPTIYVI